MFLSDWTMRATGAASGRRRPRLLLVGALIAAVSACADAGGAGDGHDLAERAARPADAAGAVQAVDDAGRTVRLPAPARRVVSLLPAGTETLQALGAGDLIVARTRYDTGPATAHLPSVGGGLDPSLEALVAVRPDLVIAWEPAGGASRLRSRLENLGIAVFSIQTRDTTDIYANIENLGRLTGRSAASAELAAGIRAELDAVTAAVPPGPRPTVLFVVSVDPPIVAGLDNFIAELIEVAGGVPLGIAGEAPGLSPQVSVEALIRRQPDLIILPVGEGASLRIERLGREPGWRELRAVREGRVREVPADLTNRPGPRIGEMARVLRAAIVSAGGRP